MFRFDDTGQRPNSHSFSQSVPYRQDDYYLQHELSSRQTVGPPTPVPRTFSSEQPHNDFYPPSPDNFYNFHNNPRHNGNTSYSGRDSFSAAGTFSEPYDRRTSSSHLNMSPNISYHTQPDMVRSSLPNLGHLKRNDIPDVLANFSLGATLPDLVPESTSALTGPSSEHSGDSDFWPSNMPNDASEPSKPRKARREKPRIELAPDQPPTTQGKPRARVYVACLQCRTRKIRCDGAKPICHNCGRRAAGGTDCNYDPVPKRRGPDKTPGARQRMARDLRNEIDSGAPRRRRRTRDHSTSEAKQVDRLTAPPEYQKPGANAGSPISLSSSASPTDASYNTGNCVPTQNYSRSSYSLCQCHGLAECPGILGVGGLITPRKPVSVISTYHDVYDSSATVPPYDTGCGYLTEVDENGNEREDSDSPDIASEPSLNFTRKVWWDSLLSLYLSPNSTRLHNLSLSQRETAAQSITSDLRFLFRASNYWFSFFHIPTFFGNFFDPGRRERIQPSLVLALLAMATFWQSSEVGYGENGRERALRFRDEAQSAMDASFNAGWIDETLAQAAWLLALFEICAHPRHSSERSSSAMVMLDSIIRSLSLTLVDADDPNASMFPSGTVPMVDSGVPKSPTVWFPEPVSHSAPDMYDANTPPGAATNEGCSCHDLTLGEHWPSAADHAPMWGSTPAWDQSWSEGEIRKESCRRLCWSSMVLAAGHISYTTAQRSQGLDLFISDPANYALLFSGESVARSPMLSGHSSKNTIWALYDRSYLLWHGCMRMRINNHVTNDDKAQFAVRAWLEADSLERALNRHTCLIERAFIFQAREYIFNTRMCISYEFQRYVPLVTANMNGLFHRNKAEEWLTHQAVVAERFMHGLHTITGNSNNLLARRPFFVFWFMGQIHRALALWQCDNTLTVALSVCKALIPAIDYLTGLWPCPEQRDRYEKLRDTLQKACLVAGVDPPPPVDFSLPPPSSPEGLV